MEFVTLSTLPGIIGRYLMMLKVTDILDIAIMVFVFYKALTLIQSTRAASLLKGVLVFLAALMLSMVLNMNSINFIMNQLVRWGVVALIVLFQPEIRRILEEVGSRRFIAFFSRAEAGTAVEQAIDQTVLACTEMSQSRTGALIVFERENLLDDMVRSGTVLDAAVSSELLKNIFFVKAPMHDGAVIVRNGRVLGARMHAASQQEREPLPGAGDAPPGRYRHERERRRRGGHRLRGDRVHLRGHRGNAQAAPQAGDAGQYPAERVASAGGRGGQAQVQPDESAAGRKHGRRQP